MDVFINLWNISFSKGKELVRKERITRLFFDELKLI